MVNENTIILIQIFVIVFFYRFKASLKDSLQRISAYNKLLVETETLRKTKFLSDDEDHEIKLTKVKACDLFL